MSSPNTHTVLAAYRRYSNIYNKLFGQSLEHGRKVMCELANATKPKQLLEVGIGTGLTLRHYSENIYITGVDISPEMLEKASNEIRNPQNTQLLIGNAEHTAFENHSFDCVTAPYIFSVTPNPKKLLSEVKRVCKPNGDIFIVNHFSRTSLFTPLEHMIKPFQNILGFRPTFSIEDFIDLKNENVVCIKDVNLLKLSKVIHIKNAKTD